MAERATQRLALLVALSGGALLATATTVGITPFLLEMARDLDTDLTAAGNLVAIQSVAGAPRPCSPGRRAIASAVGQSWSAVACCW
jgi:predicted MFS family arabinose efflux permease